MKVLDRGLFAKCLQTWLVTDYIGKAYKEHLKFNKDDGTLVGFKSRITQNKIESLAKDGVEMLKEIRRLEKDYGLDETYSYSRRHMDIDQYSVFLND